jgi:hypothetical protein
MSNKQYWLIKRLLQWCKIKNHAGTFYLVQDYKNDKVELDEELLEWLKKEFGL